MIAFISNRLFPEILNMSLTGSIVILAVLVIRFFLRKAPKKWSYLLWLVVAFRLACPVSLPSPISLLGAVNAPVTTEGTIEYIPQTIVRPQTPVVSPVTPSPAPSTPNAVTPDVTTPAPQLPAAPEPVSVTDILTVVWLIGMAMVLIYSVVSYLRLRRRLAEAILYHDNVWQSDRVQSPFILGFFRPRIYIPFGLDQQTMSYVLAHEHCHLRRKDHIIKPLAFLLLTVHWFNPLCWLAFHLMGRDMEMSCDEQVLARENGDRKVYSTALLSFAANRRFPAPSPLAFGEGEVRPRITNALNWKAPKVWVTAAAGVLCVAVLLLCALNPLSNSHPYPFGFYYRVSELTYTGPESSDVLPYENLQIHLSEERKLTITGDGLTLRANFSEKTKLTPEEFDTMFDSEHGIWAEGRSAAQLRENNRTVWRFFDISNARMTSALLLQQEDSSLYLVLDYTDNPLDSSSIHPTRHWVLKLERSSVVSAALSSAQGYTTIEPRRYKDGKFDYDYDALPSGTIYGTGNLSLHTQMPGQTITVDEHHYWDSTGMNSIHQETYTLTANSAGVCNRKIEPIAAVPEADYAIYYVTCNGDKYVFRVNFAAPTTLERYRSVDEYLTAALAGRRQISLAAEGGGALTTPVTDRRVLRLDKLGELPALASEGTLELWGYEYELKLDVDPDRVLMAGGMNVSDDGWFALDYPHNVVTLLDADGYYTILYDEPNFDGLDFWGGRTPEEAIHDWYVNAYNLTDTHPPYIVDWRDLSYTSDLLARRYDGGDVWYIYIPLDTWLPSSGTGNWRSAYGTGAGFSVMDSMDDLTTTLRIAQAEGWSVTSEGNCYRIDRENNSSFVYPQPDGERVMIVYVHWPDAPSENIYHPSPEQEKEELLKIARSFAYYNANPASPETLRTAAEQAATDWLSDLSATDTVIGVTVHRAVYDEEMTRNVLKASDSLMEDTYACVRVEYSVCCDDSHPVAFSFSHPFPDGSGRYTGLMSLTRNNASEPWQYSSMPSTETLDLFRSVPPTEGEWTRMRGGTPEEAVRSTLEQQGQKHHISSLTVDSIQLDQTLLTYENIKGLKRSELAQLMGWNERYLDTSYAAVMARYTVRYKEPWSRMDGTYQTLFHLLRDEASGTWILMEPLSTRGITIQDNPELEQALTAMIQEHYAPEQPDGLYHTQSYTVVDMLDYKRTAPSWVGWYRHLYTVVLNQSYDLSGATPRLVSESHSMDMITVTYIEPNHYLLVSYRTPTQEEFDSDPFDTATHVSDKGVAAAANLSQYYPEQSQLCYEKALAYKNSLL
ncbi:MAG: hypothetical protein J6A62_02375 [Oscillospiraceae bacterium]|nr:hypothetical protein [Oscillospiraceae bacterium]